VQVPGDPVPVFEHRQPLRVAAPLRQLQRDRGLRRERRDELHGGPRKRLTGTAQALDRATPIHYIGASSTSAMGRR
jgi:hypothetical protein